MSIYMLSKLTGLTYPQIKDIENGTSSYTMDSLFKYLYAVDLNLAIHEVVEQNQ